MRGHVRKRGERWEFVVDLGLDPGTGKRRQKWHSGYRTRRDAESALAEVLRQLARGGYVDPSKFTLGEYLREEWLPSRRPKSLRAGRGHRGQVGVGTWDTYRRDIEAYIVPHVGAVPLRKLEAEHLERLYDRLEERGGRNHQGLSPKTVANVHGLLHKALEDAVKRGRRR